MHGDVLDKSLEIFVLGHEIGLAVHFYKHADLAAGMDVRADQAFGGNPAGFLGSGSKPLRAQIVNGLFLVSAGFRQGLFAIHEACSGNFSQFIHLRCCNAHVYPP